MAMAVDFSNFSNAFSKPSMRAILLYVILTDAVVNTVTESAIRKNNSESDDSNPSTF